MGFRLGSFLAGMAEGAIEIEENARKRNEKIIDAEFERYRQREEDNRKTREASQEEYDQLARILNDLPGMSAAKTYAVLNYGPEIATNFIAKAPELAKKEGLLVGDYVDLMDKDAINSSLNVNTLIRAGKLPGMPGPRAFDVPATLIEKSPVFQRDYTGYAKRLAGATEVEEQTDIALPQGKIKFMDMVEGKQKKVPYLTGGQVIDKLTEQFYRDFGVGFRRDRNGMLVVTDDDKSLSNQAEQAAMDTYGSYTGLIGEGGQFDVEVDQYPAIMEAYESYYMGDASVNVTLGGQSTPAPSPAPAQAKPSVTIPNSNITITMNSQGFPSMGIPMIIQSIIQANPGISKQNAQKQAKQLLDELKAKAK